MKPTRARENWRITRSRKYALSPCRDQSREAVERKTGLRPSRRLRRCVFETEVTLSSEWRSQASRLVQQAQEHAARGDIRAASDAVDSAFGIVDERGTEQDVVFVAVLVVAADITAMSGDTESAAALYKRASEVCHAFGDGTLDGTHALALLARAYLGLARADADRAYSERARERYAIALRHMEACVPPPPRELLDQIRNEMGSV